jgi:hypothetical protein
MRDFLLVVTPEDGQAGEPFFLGENERTGFFLPRRVNILRWFSSCFPRAGGPRLFAEDPGEGRAEPGPLLFFAAPVGEGESFVLLGLTLESGPGDIARAVCESLAYHLLSILGRGEEETPIHGVGPWFELPRFSRVLAYASNRPVLVLSPEEARPEASAPSVKSAVGTYEPDPGLHIPFAEAARRYEAIAEKLIFPLRILADIEKDVK